MEPGTEVVAAQHRLLKKRAEHEAMANLTLVTSKPEEIGDIIERCKTLSSVHVSDVGDEKTIIPVPIPKGYYIDGLPMKYKTHSFHSFLGNEKLVTGVKEYCKLPNGLFFHGPTGCGKTHLATAAAYECLQAGINTRAYRNNGGVDAMFVTAPELLLAIRSSFSDKAKRTEQEIIDEYSGVGLLILDDLGAEKTSEFAITSLYLIIDRRNRNNKQTIITSNLSPKEIEEKLDARIASRIADMKIINLSKLGDYRKKRT